MKQTVDNTTAAAFLALMMFVSVSLMFGGKRGWRWAWRLILAPVRTILAAVERKVGAVVAILVIIVLSGFGVLNLFRRIMAWHP
jgi:hypothetical protein